MLDRDISKVTIHVPTRRGRTTLGGIAHALSGIFLAPPYWLLAAFLSTPGLDFRRWCCALGIRAIFRTSRPLSLRAIFHLLLMPMESTRYFEFAVVNQMLRERPVRRYLDVSSPRLMPIYLLDSRSEIVADLINPNVSDLEETARFVELLRTRQKCRLHNCLIADAPFTPGTFDTITSISVIEHIPEDLEAVRQLWSLLKPGGVLVLTVPCMAKASEQYIDRDEWGLLERNDDGNVFWQRFYDMALLEQRIFCITGKPKQVAIYGEKLAGSLLRNSERKRSDPSYPYWREPYMMGKEYQAFDSLDALPGEGVVGLLFEKIG